MLLSVYLGNYRRFQVCEDSLDGNPREFDTVGTIITTNNRYFTGDEILDDDWDAKRAEIENNGGVVIPIEATIHSGVYLRHVDEQEYQRTDFDRGIIGYNYVTHEKIVECFGDDLYDNELREKAIKTLSAELETLNNYLTYGAYCGCYQRFNKFTGEYETFDCTGGFLTNGNYYEMIKEILEHFELNFEERQMILEKAKDL